MQHIHRTLVTGMCLLLLTAGGTALDLSGNTVIQFGEPTINLTVTDADSVESLAILEDQVALEGIGFSVETGHALQVTVDEVERYAPSKQPVFSFKATVPDGASPSATFTLSGLSPDTRYILSTPDGRQVFDTQQAGRITFEQTQWNGAKSFSLARNYTPRLNVPNASISLVLGQQLHLPIGVTNEYQRSHTFRVEADSSQGGGPVRVLVQDADDITGQGRTVTVPQESAETVVLQIIATHCLSDCQGETITVTLTDLDTGQKYTKTLRVSTSRPGQGYSAAGITPLQIIALLTAALVTIVYLHHRT